MCLYIVEGLTCVTNILYLYLYLYICVACFDQGPPAWNKPVTLVRARRYLSEVKKAVAQEREIIASIAAAQVCVGCVRTCLGSCEGGRAKLTRV
jgi:hypothetical protein